MNKFTTGNVLTFSDFEAMKKREIRDRVLIFSLSLLIAFFPITIN